jgi:hypothetical protein
MSYIPVRLGDLVKHKHVNFGLGIIVQQERAFVVVKWFGLENKTSQSPHDVRPVIEKENNEV